MVDFKLYAITDQWVNVDLKRFVSEAAGYGLRALRMRDQPTDEFLSRTFYFREAMQNGRFFISSPGGTEMSVRSTASFASTVVHADGIHLPESAIDGLWMRERIKEFFTGIVGISVHSKEAAIRAEALGADFVTFGAVFESPSKRAMGFEAQGLEALHAVVNSVSIPVFAIGGITLAHAQACLQVGAWGVAVIRDLLLAPNLEERMAQYKEILGAL